MHSELAQFLLMTFDAIVNSAILESEHHRETFVGGRMGGRGGEEEGVSTISSEIISEYEWK